LWHWPLMAAGRPPWWSQPMWKSCTQRTSRSARRRASRQFAAYVPGWVTSGGTWAVETDGSKVYSQTATATGSTVMLSANGSTSWTNQIVEAKIKVKAFGGSSTSYLAAIYARYTGSDYYALALRSDGKVAIRHGNSTLGSAVTAGIVEGTWYTVRFELVGSSLKAYVDGALKDSETDTSLTAGGIAVSCVNTTAEFDDVKVTTP